MSWATLAIEALTIPGLPGWTGLGLLLLLGLLAASVLLMPFSVFGVKGRLDAIEAQLDEVRAELRALTARLPEARGARYSESDIDLPSPAPRAEGLVRGHPSLPSRGRAEPRVGWPKG
jgi:hypothetical protein